MTDRKILYRYPTNKLESILYEDQVKIEWQPEVKSVRVTMTMPEKRNSMPMAFWCWLSDFITNQVNPNDEVKTFVLAGDGEHFGGGNDANELGYYIGYGTGKTESEQKRPSQRQRMIPDRDMVFGTRGIEQAIHRCLKVTIFEVHGMCYGIHMELAMLADVVIAAEDTLFTHPAYRYLGPFGNVNVIVENMGIKKAKEMILTARPLTAQELSTNSIVTRVVPRAELRKTTDEYCQAVSLLPMDGICMGKALIEQALETRGYGMSFVQSWIGHGWFTNLSYGPGEFNYLKSRRDKGMKDAVYERDKKAPKAWRMGRSRFEKE